ncbi:MAG: PDZ domain-containing protein [Actinomycetota bacterium]|nr:PDZ domain-containing protein [Actinomycetota bacterium]
MRNSTDTALHAWGAERPFGTRGLPAPDDLNERLDRWSLAGHARHRGVVLTSAPRPGSPLATAAVEQGDRILEIDGVEVNSNPEIQDALTAKIPERKSTSR